MDDQTGRTEATEHTAPLGTEHTGATAVPTPEEPSSGFHPVQTGYLVTGLVALGIALLWLLTELDLVEVGDGGVAFSALLVVAGAIGLVASLVRAR
jgi:hypothetical protein